MVPIILTSISIFGFCFCVRTIAHTVRSCDRDWLNHQDAIAAAERKLLES